MPKAKTPIKNKKYPEVDDIKQDLSSLKHNVVGLSEHVAEDGAKVGEQAADSFFKKMTEFKVFGRKQAAKAEVQVRDNPAKSLAVAFVSGLFLSAFFKSKK